MKLTQQTIRWIDDEPDLSVADRTHYITDATIVNIVREGEETIGEWDCENGNFMPVYYSFSDHCWLLTD